MVQVIVDIELTSCDWFIHRLRFKENDSFGCVQLRSEFRMLMTLTLQQLECGATSRSFSIQTNKPDYYFISLGDTMWAVREEKEI